MDFILYVLKRILAVAFLAGVSLAILYHGTPWIIAFVLVLLYLLFHGTSSPAKK